MIALVDNWHDQKMWDEFVVRNIEARFCLLYGYKHVLECYGYEMNPVCFIKDNNIVAVAPITVIHSYFRRQKLISQPFSEYGGVLIDPVLTEKELLQIINTLQVYLSENYPHINLEIHGNHGIPEAINDSLLYSRNPHFIAYLPLNEGVDVLWDKIISYEARKAVKKARKSDVIVHSECNKSVVIDYFFPLYLKSMKRLGVPPHKVEYFLQSVSAFGENMKIFWANIGSNSVAALLGFKCGKRFSITNTVSDPAYWQFRPNDILHWELIKYALESGCSYFDFGSVRYTGQEHFKKKWGCRFKEHNYYFMKGREDNTRIQTFDSSSPLMSKFSALWAHYVPDKVASTLGPSIRRRLAR